LVRWKTHSDECAVEEITVDTLICELIAEFLEEDFTVLLYLE